jgi:uncharacterized protein (DUF4213/DUF364 family)
MKAVEAWIADLKKTLSSEAVKVSDARIGVFYTAVRLSTGHVGVAFTPRGLAESVCCPRSAAAAPEAGKIRGQDAWQLSGYALTTSPLRRALGVAVLNALSALAMASRPPAGVEVLRGADALDAACVEREDTVAMVGGFTPFIKRLKGSVRELWILDKHSEALNPDETLFWRSTERAAEVLSKASIVVMTGSALVEGGVDDLLAAARRARKVVMAGPTASPWPLPFFERGVDVLGGIRILDGEKILQIVSEGGSGYFFDEAAEKVCIVPESKIFQPETQAVKSAP